MGRGMRRRPLGAQSADGWRAGEAFGQGGQNRGDSLWVSSAGL